MGRPSRRGGFDRTANTSKSERRERRKARRAPEREGYGEMIPVKPVQPRIPEFKPRTNRQDILARSIKRLTCVFAVGPAGTGKTHVAIAIAVILLLLDPTFTLVLTNPAVEIAEKLGTLPGDKDDKIAVSTRPLRDILVKLLGASHVENLVRAERIMFEPLGSILGRTFDNAMVVFDEAQNSTPQQMKALLSRTGENTKVVVCGDFKEQTYIDGPSGLEDAVIRFGNSPNVGIVEFTVDDIVRSGFCKEVILAYRQS